MVHKGALVLTIYSSIGLKEPKSQYCGLQLAHVQPDKQVFSNHSSLFSNAWPVKMSNCNILRTTDIFLFKMISLDLRFTCLISGSNCSLDMVLKERMANKQADLEIRYVIMVVNADFSTTVSKCHL